MQDGRKATSSDAADEWADQWADQGADGGSGRRSLIDSGGVLDYSGRTVGVPGAPGKGQGPPIELARGCERNVEEDGLGRDRIRWPDPARHRAGRLGRHSRKWRHQE